MPFTGNTFGRNQDFTSDLAAGLPHKIISASKMDDEFDNVAEGLTTAKTAAATASAANATHAARTDDPHSSASQAVSTIRGGVATEGNDLSKLYTLILARYTETEADALLATKSDVGHDHDTDYYLVSEMNDLLDLKSNVGHTHADATTSVAGFMSAADKTTLDNLSVAAGGGATDAQLRDRSTHTGSQAISTVTGLQTALDGKASTSHTHSISAITSLQTTLDGKASTSHTHAISSITSLQSSLDAKAAASHSHTTSQITGLDASLSSLDSRLDAIEASGAEGWELYTTATISAGTGSYSATGLTGREFMLEVSGLSHDNAGSVGFQIYLSTTNGSSYPYTSDLSTAVAGSSTSNLIARVGDGASTAGLLEVGVGLTGATGGKLTRDAYRHGLTGVNAIRLRAAVGTNMDAGSVRVYQRT
jgi:hypothetical protein